jgi:hypothetical protein
VKAAPAAGLEIKQTIADWDAERRERARGLPKLTTCSVCGHTAGAILPRRIPRRRAPDLPPLHRRGPGRHQP